MSSIQLQANNENGAGTERAVHVAFAGNPNCGKTTLFNALTGSGLKVANWPGVTVEKKEGTTVFNGAEYRMVDLPGTYSLSSYTMEEIVARNYITDDEADVIINIVDASCLERNLYLTLQLIELGKPVVLAMNMMDIVEERGMQIDLHRLPEMLGVPVIPVSARKQTGLKVLMHAVEHHINHPKDYIEHHHTQGHHAHDHHSEYTMVYSDEIEDKIDAISDFLRKTFPEPLPYRWIAIKYLEDDPEVKKQYPIDLNQIGIQPCEARIINEKYQFIEEIMEEVVVNRDEQSEKTDRADRILTHRIWGVPCFLGIMALVFFLTFTVGDFLKEYLLFGLDFLTDSARTAMESFAPAWLTSLVVDGIISGVGGILSFLPNIFILFLALAFLEDSGYMSRVAYVMDGIMGRIGLSGRAFIPMLLGFGCTVPAVMATRALEDPRDRRRAMLATPFMSCSARLPVYVLLSEMFFGNYAFFATISMYIIGALIGILIAFIVGKADKKHARHSLLIELPEYKMPNARTVFIYVWDKIKDYLTKAGTTIFVASVIIWFLLHFGIDGMTDDMSRSFGAMIGKVLAPLMIPCGLGYWQIAVSLISGLAAKEVVVSSMSVLYGITNVASGEGMAQFSQLLIGTGFNAVNAYSMLLFVLLYIPCAATIGAMARESRSVRWTLRAIGMQLGVAWLVSTLFYQVASLF